MTNLRWILLFAGLAILLLLYFSGRPKKAHNKTDAHGNEPDARRRNPDNRGQRRDPADGQRETQSGAASSQYDMGLPEPSFDPDALAADISVNPGQSRHRMGAAPGHDPLMDGAHSGGVGADEPYPTSYDDQRAAAHARARGLQPGVQEQDSGRAQAGGYSPRYGTDYASDPSELTTTDLFGNLDPDDLERPGGAAEPYGFNPPEDHSQSMGASIGEKIEAFSARLTPKRKTRVAASAPEPSAEDNTDKGKIVSLHVVAPSGQIINGQLLLDTFESRGYLHGDMNIYHSLHQGKTVFSIAKMVMPGVFDVNDISSYETPGITLFLQLPGPVQGDVAFEVLISEAHELATALGCHILDSERSTLSRQTVQHLRESVYEFMHRQKYFNKVPS